MVAASSRRIIDSPGQLHFVTFSTYQRRRFLSTERARLIVMEVLQDCLEKHRAGCHGFVVMPDHVHALLTVHGTSGIGAFLQVWKKTSSYRIKRFYGQGLRNYHALCPPDGPVWQARFYDFNVESDRKFAEKLEYMHNNPVSARMVEVATDWVWSSARFYEGERWVL